MKLDGALALEKELCAELHEPRRRRADDLAERGTVDVSIDRLRPEELSVVEDVEALEAKLNRFGFRQAHRLEQGHIEVNHTRAVEKAASCGSRRAEGVLAELGAIEIGAAVARISVRNHMNERHFIGGTGLRQRAAQDFGRKCCRNQDIKLSLDFRQTFRGSIRPRPSPTKTI